MQEEKQKCPLGICDGSGIVTMGEHDDIHDEKCECAKKIDDEIDHD